MIPNIQRIKIGLVLSLLLAFTVLAESKTGKLLDELDLRSSQRAEINAVLIGGMQSLEAINKEILKLEQSKVIAGNNPELEHMYMALVEQRFRLVEIMASDILSVLDSEQLQKFDFGHLIESLPQDVGDTKAWKQEI
jgi:hypothetical protein